MTSSEIIYTFTDDDPRARFTMGNFAYRALTIRESAEGMLSVDVVHVNKSTGADWKRARRFVWLTLPHSLDRFAPDFAAIVRSVIADARPLVVGDVVTFDTLEGPARGIVCRVWPNGQYVTMQQVHDGRDWDPDMFRVWTRCVSNVHRADTKGSGNV